MLRFCVLGNSHVAALKTGWDELPEPYKARLSATYFAAQGDLLEELEVRNQSLVARSEGLRSKLAATSNGMTRIDCRDYDVFVIVGLNLSLRRMMTSTLSLHRTSKFKAKHDPDAADMFLVSDACVLQSAIGVLGDSLAFEVAKKLQAAGASRIIIVPQPTPSAQILDRGKVGGQFREFQKSGDGPEVYRLFKDALLALAKTRGLEVVEQPAHTRQDGFLSKREYSVGSVRLTAGLDSLHPEGDYGHLNSRYGAELWQKIMSSSLLENAPARGQRADAIDRSPDLNGL